MLNPSLQVTLIPFELGKVVFNRDPKHNLLLSPGDTITVFSRNDFRGPLEQRTRFVKIEGEVVRPGMYTVQAGDTLRTLFEKAGGVTPLGYLYGTQLFRESVRQQQQRPLAVGVRGFGKLIDQCGQQQQTCGRLPRLVEQRGKERGNFGLLRNEQHDQAHLRPLISLLLQALRLRCQG